MKIIKKTIKFLRYVLPFLLVGIILTTVLSYSKKETKENENTIVRIWNIDTFEGGKGSRTAFLKRVANTLQKQNSNIYYLVTSMSCEGAIHALKEGNLPDMLSFGVGLADYAEYSLPLKRKFSGGELGGKVYAVPWCRGGYALFSLKNDFDNDGSVAISKGGNNLPIVSAVCEGIEGEEVESLVAYTSFLNGKYRYLLGTQRDLCRFETRNIQVYYKPLTQYCDLYQYVSILSSDKVRECELYLDELLSNRVQEKLSSIGMYSIYSKNDFLGESVQRTVSVFCDIEGLKQIEQCAREVKVKKNLEKFLKYI